MLVESEIQKACVRWFRYAHSNIANLLFAVPNGGYRNAREAARMKAEGVTAGVADLILLLPNKEHSSLCIELKAPKGKQSASQKEWGELAQKNGNKYVIVHNIEEFIKEITYYLKDKIINNKID